MIRRRNSRIVAGVRSLAWAFLALFCAAGFSNAQLTPDAPILGFRLPSFDETTGYRIWEIVGAEARYKSEFEIEIFDMQLQLFEEGIRVTTTITSPHAHVFPSAKRAFGPTRIRVETEEYTLEGEDWSWDAEGPMISVARNAKVQFKESFDALLQ